VAIKPGAPSIPRSNPASSFWRSNPASSFWRSNPASSFWRSNPASSFWRSQNLRICLVLLKGTDLSVPETLHNYLWL
jgi:hypothetical protein